MNPRNPKVAVIGPFFNGENLVQGWINSVAFQSYSNLCVYIVDDASTDKTLETIYRILKDRKLPYQVIAIPRNVGPAAARNIGIRKALHDDADLILLLDSDGRVETDWAERHARLHAERSPMGILGGSIQGKSATFVGRADGFCSWFTAVPQTPHRPIEKMHLSTTNMSIKRSVFEQIGFFDEQLATGEDVAFCRRAQKAGILLWMQSDIVMTHLDRDDLEAAKRHHYRWGLHSFTLSCLEGGGYYYFLTKVRNRLIVAALVPVIAVLNTVLILAQFSRKRPSVWLHLPWIAYLKWWNAVGVYHGFLEPTLCLKK